MSARGSLGLAQGFAAGNRRRDLEAKQEEERQYERGRQVKADARADETYQYQKGRRGLQDSLDQINLRNAQTQASDNDQAHARAAQAAQDEGFVDLLTNLQKGVNPAEAERDYNSRGTHKISGTRLENGRLKFSDEGGERDVDPNQLLQVIKGRQTDSTKPPAKKTQHVIGNQLVNEDGTVAFTGKDKPAKEDNGTWVQGKDGTLYNNKTGKTRDGKDYLGGAKPGDSGGESLTPAEIRQRRTAMRTVLGSLAKMQYDPKTDQIIGGAAGDTERWGSMSAEGERLMQAHPELGEAQIANLVHQNLGQPGKTDEELRAQAMKDDPRKQLTDPSKPDSFWSRAEPDDVYNARIDQAVQKQRQAGREAAIKQLDADAQAAVQTMRPVAAPAAAAPAAAPAAAAAPARTTGRGASAQDTIRPEQITGSDPNMVAAVQKSPSLLRLLTQKPTTPGKLMGVKINGRMFYLAGTELRELPLNPGQ